MLVAVMWLVTIIEQLFELNFGSLGVNPRSLDGLKGIITSPLIHSGFKHLISNSVPFMVSGTIMMYFFKNVSFKAFGWMYFITGLGVWIFARGGVNGGPLYHIGASGVVYAMVAFVFFCGVFVRNRLSIVLALVMILLYSGMIQGILPNKEGISWESHLIGGIVGVGVALFFRKAIKEGHRTENWDDAPPTPEEPKEHFLPRDVFDKTKTERLNNHE